MPYGGSWPRFGFGLVYRCRVKRAHSCMETIVSSIAATLTTAAFLPQAYKIIHSRETAGVSLLMHVTFAAGVAFWFALGVILWNWPMMIANALTFVLTMIIVTMKLYYG